MPVKVDDTLLESKGLSQGMGNYPDLILAKRDGQKRIDDLSLAHVNVVNLNTKQIAAQDLLDNKTKEKNAAIQAAKEAVVQVQEAAKSAFEGDKAMQKMFRVGDPKPKTDEGWEAYLDPMVGPVHLNGDALIANGMSPEDVANFPTVYANVIASLAVQKNTTKVRNAATSMRDAAVGVLSRKITTTRNFAKAAFKGNKAALEEIKPIKKGGKSKKNPPTPPAPPAPEPPQSTQK